MHQIMENCNEFYIQIIISNILKLNLEHNKNSLDDVV
jgi:hypothetical protein